MRIDSFPSLVVAILIVIAILGVTYSVSKKHGQSDSGAPTLPDPPPHQPIAERRFAATILGICALTAYLWILFNHSTGGLMHLLEDAPPKTLLPFVLGAAVSAVGILVALFLTLKGRIRTAVTMLVVLLTLHAWGGNGGFELLDPQTVDQSSKQVLSFELSEDLRDTELWCNGVLLGTMPVILEESDFVKTVPDEYQPPAGTENIEWTEYDQNGVEVKKTAQTRFAVAKKGLFDPSEQNSVEEGSTFHFQVMFQDRPLGGRITRAGTGRSGRFTRHIAWTILPDTNLIRHRMSGTLDQIRAVGFQPDTAQLNALEPYGNFAFKTVTTLAAQEPAWADVLEHWSHQRYPREQEPSASTALSVFRAIQEQADRQRRYDTRSIEGWTIESITHALPQKALVQEAMSWLKKSRQGRYFQNYYHGWWNGEAYFGTSKVPQNLQESPFPPRCLVLAHAIWIQDLQEIGHQPGRTSEIERLIAPELLRQGAEDLAFALGGAVVDRFLARQNWRSEPSHSHNNLSYYQARPVNRWFLALMTYQGPAGDDFRKNHRQAIFNFVEQNLTENPWDLSVTEFLLRPDRDRDASPDLALEFWPRMLEIPSRTDEELYNCWRYLARLEPHTPLQWYVDAWNRFPEQWHSPGSAESAIHKLPDTRRSEILNAVLSAVRQAPPSPNRPQEETQSIIQDLESRLPSP